MALNATGPISIGGTTVGQSINLELNLSATDNSSIGQTNFRTLANISSGTISLDDFHGKSNIIVIPPIDANTNQYILYSANVPGYVPGSAKIELSIDSGVYLYSTNTLNPALTFFGFEPGDVITVKNSGYIIGCGGNGGGVSALSPAPSVTTYPATAGGSAISTTCDVVLENNGYIAGGGGGGAINNKAGSGGGAGGGGAGGGLGGSSFSGPPNILQPGGTGGAPGAVGGDGQRAAYGTPGGAVLWCGGGGGGRILPGVGGAGGQQANTGNDNGKGGGAGGGGGGAAEAPPGGGYTYMNLGGAGGSAGAAGNDGAYSFPGNFGVTGGGGGGGWGASGGMALNYNHPTTPGAAGGKAVALNGYTATITGSGVIYGAVS
jgi:hypothetical protein